MRADRLKKVMEDQGHNPESLGEIVSVSPRQIWRWLSGENVPNADLLAACATTLEVSADYLLGISDDPSPSQRGEVLTSEQRKVLAALRRGEKMEAIRIIATEH